MSRPGIVLFSQNVKSPTIPGRFSLYESKEKLIDLMLVGRRNHVAHGEAIEVGNDDFIDMADQVLGLMNTFKNLLENSCIYESYKVP